MTLTMDETFARACDLMACAVGCTTAFAVQRCREYTPHQIGRIVEGGRVSDPGVAIENVLVAIRENDDECAKLRAEQAAAADREVRGGSPLGPRHQRMAELLKQGQTGREVEPIPAPEPIEEPDE